MITKADLNKIAKMQWSDSHCEYIKGKWYLSNEPNKPELLGKNAPDAYEVLMTKLVAMWKKHDFENEFIQGLFEHLKELHESGVLGRIMNRKTDKEGTPIIEKQIDAFPED
jgi:hypothetical protein